LFCSTLTEILGDTSFSDSERLEPGGSLADLKLLAVCRLQRPADDRPARAGHPDPFVLCSAVQLSAVAVLIKEGDQAGEEVAQIAGIRFVW
jgi:hypothetical protein